MVCQYYIIREMINATAIGISVHTEPKASNECRLGYAKQPNKIN